MSLTVIVFEPTFKKLEVTSYSDERLRYTPTKIGLKKSDPRQGGYDSFSTGLAYIQKSELDTPVAYDGWSYIASETKDVNSLTAELLGFVVLRAENNVSRQKSALQDTENKLKELKLFVNKKVDNL